MERLHSYILKNATSVAKFMAKQDGSDNVKHRRINNNNNNNNNNNSFKMFYSRRARIEAFM